MNRMHVRNAFDHGRFDAQTSQAGFVQQQCYCKDIQLIQLMFVSGIHSRHSSLDFDASNPYQKLEVPESGSTLHQFCIMLASCPSLRCSCRKKTSLMQRSRGFGRGVVVSKICYVQYSDCVQDLDYRILILHDFTLSCDT